MKNDIKEILNNYKEAPSSNCWNRIEHQLNTVMPVSNNLSPNIANQTSGFLSSSIGKFVAIVAAGALITTSIIVFLNLNKETEVVKNENYKNINQNENLVVSDKNETIIETKTVSKNSDKIYSDTSKQSNILKIVDEPQKENIFEISNLTEKIEDNKETKKTETTEHKVKETQNEKPIKEPTKKDSVVKKEDNITNDTKTKELIENDNKLPFELTIPNVITPNGDGYNDFLVFKGIEQYTKSKLIIFTNKGKKIFEANNYSNNWDGEQYPAGFYYFILELFYNNKSFSLKGNISIIRD